MAKRKQKAASAVNQARNSIRRVENWGNTAIGRTPGRRCKVTWLTASDPRPTCWLDLAACFFMKSISIVDVQVFPCSPINNDLRLARSRAKHPTLLLCIFGFSKGKGDASVVLTLNVHPSTISFAVHISDS